eukprot:TRINITY_DN611_c0_g1_i1.p1 TRINITY_DN611_c0_g1~~TRINITY_DN611_c0_g1_i1.p1  ORF type:complete len:262 (-),score=27.20 TRINITY_DN611_c0_g1_i1:43-828(-)
MECPICTDIFRNEDDLLQFHCGHIYCRQCIVDYITYRINANEVIDIPCPDPSCGYLFDYSFIKEIITPDLFERYESFTLLESLKNDSNIRWCPNPMSCGNAMIVESGFDLKKIKCRVCEYSFCGLCSEEAHEGSCEENKKSLEYNDDDFEFYYWSRKNSSNCPNCHIRIQKNSGCNHMTCSNCRFQFCWLCKGEYNAYHFSGANPYGCFSMQYSEENGAVRLLKKTFRGTVRMASVVYYAGFSLPYFLGVELVGLARSVRN